MLTRVLLALPLFACSGGIVVDGVDVQLQDAVFARWAAYTPQDEARDITVLLSDAPDLCALLKEQRSLAGYTLLSVRRRFTGTAQMRFVRYDRGCEMLEEDSADDGWAELNTQHSESATVDFAFFGARRGITGHAQAGYCEPARNARGCYWSSISR